MCLRVYVCPVKSRAQLHNDVSSEVMVTSIWCEALWDTQNGGATKDP